MNFYQARSILRRLTYKVGWSFELEPDEDSCALLFIRYLAPDSTAPQPAQTIMIAATERIPLLGADDEAAFVRRVREAIARVERHEIDEWIRLDGRLVRDPHTHV